MEPQGPAIEMMNVESRLSIGFVSPGWPPEAYSNGIVTYLAALIPQFRAMGHRVSILAGQVAGELNDPSVYDTRRALTERSLPQRIRDRLWHHAAARAAAVRQNTRSLTATTRRVAAEQALDVVEVEEGQGSARRMQRCISLPVCVRLHGPWFLNGSALGAREDASFRHRVRREGRAIVGADGVSAPSDDVLQRVRSYYGIDLEDAEVIPNAVKPVPPGERWRLEGCHPRRVLFVGRFDRHKGGDLVVEAFGRVLHEVPDAGLCFVGPDNGCTAGDGRTWRLEDFVRQRLPGALESGRVEWLGQRPFPELASLRRGAMVAVVCSRYENFPGTVTEAMALGCPLVAARIGGIPEIVQDGVNGLLHRPDDPDDLAQKMIALLREPARAAHLGRQAAADCERRFHPEVIAYRLEGFYRRVIERAGRNGRRRRS